MTTAMDALTLYAVEAAMAAAAALIVIPPLWRARSGARRLERDPAREALLEALRAERREIEEALRSGAIESAEAQALLADLRRRALEETRAAGSEPEVGGSARAWIPVVLAVVLGGSAAVYALVGSPELIELSEAQKVLEGRAPAEAVARYLERHPKDARAWVLLAHRRVEADDFSGAVEAYRRAIAASPKVAEDPDVLFEYGAAALTANEKGAFEDAKKRVLRGLALRPESGKGLEISAMLALATRDWKLARRQLAAIVRLTPPDTPQRRRFEAALRELDARIAAERPPVRR